MDIKLGQKPLSHGGWEQEGTDINVRTVTTDSREGVEQRRPGTTWSLSIQAVSAHRRARTQDPEEGQLCETQGIGSQNVKA